MTDHIQKLISTINNNHPLVLLSGQSIDHSSIKDYNEKTNTITKLQLTISEQIKTNSLNEETFQKILSYYQSNVEPKWFEYISRLPLNAIFTTSINPNLKNNFRVGGRDVCSVLNNQETPTTPRNTNNLNTTYIFGCIGEKDINNKAPINKKELIQRTALHANPLLSRIKETTTSIGMLLIEKLYPSQDLINPETLFGILSTFKPSQILWFSWNEHVSESDRELFQTLTVPDGPIVFVEQSLSSVIETLQNENLINLTLSGSFKLNNSITIKNTVLTLDPSVRLKTSISTNIIDDEWLNVISETNKEPNYNEFRKFHGYPDSVKNLIEGIQLGYAIERTFEKEFKKHVSYALNNIGHIKHPIILHGQSGVGKSIALARLAYEIRNEKNCPVLFASRSLRLPAVDELDEFCLNAEDAGADATLLICDANAPLHRYRDLLHGFQSRGRRVVVVGSTYRLLSKKNIGKSFFEVPSVLDRNETKKIKSLLKKFTQIDLNKQISEEILPTIYHILPEVRPRLAQGLANEAQVEEDHLRTKISKHTQQNQQLTSMQIAFLNSKRIDLETIIENRLTNLNQNTNIFVSKLINYTGSS